MLLTDCKTESPQEALEIFEEAVRKRTWAAYNRPNDSVILEANQEYEAAKAELLKWMSYIP